MGAVTLSSAISPCSISDLPTELLVNIFSKLSYRDISLGTALVCKDWSEISKVNFIWATLSKRELPSWALKSAFRQINTSEEKKLEHKELYKKAFLIMKEGHKQPREIVAFMN